MVFWTIRQVSSAENVVIAQVKFQLQNDYGIM